MDSFKVKSRPDREGCKGNTGVWITYKDSGNSKGYTVYERNAKQDRKAFKPEVVLLLGITKWGVY